MESMVYSAMSGLSGFPVPGADDGRKKYKGVFLLSGRSKNPTQKPDSKPKIESMAAPKGQQIKALLWKPQSRGNPTNPTM